MNQIRSREKPEVFFEDEWLIAVSKEKEELTVPGRGSGMEDCLMSRCARWFGEVYNIHRLDQPTSGLVIVARNRDAQRRMSILFQERKVYKEYEAVVRGNISGENGLIDYPIRGDIENRPVQIIDLDRGKEAKTEWIVLERGQGWTKVLLIPSTGRTHQLRLHMKAIGHPILGDRLYNDEVSPETMGELKLHARRIRFCHPFTGAVVDIVRD